MYFLINRKIFFTTDATSTLAINRFLVVLVVEKTPKNNYWLHWRCTIKNLARNRPE